MRERESQFQLPDTERSRLNLTTSNKVRARFDAIYQGGWKNKLEPAAINSAIMTSSCKGRVQKKNPPVNDS